MSADRFLIDNVAPSAIVRPSAVAELSDLIRRAAAERIGLFPVGGRTELHIGMPPTKPGIAVDMTVIDQVIDYPARDMTITVMAGITIAKLQAILAAENQRLPIDVVDPERATLGGAIAVNASGPRRFGFGTLRDYVIGISFMTDEGTEVKAGGRVVKNVAGYDLCKLQIGAFGTLGIITTVTLKLRPLPEDQGQAVILCRAADLPGLLDRIHSSRTQPICIEVQSKDGAEYTSVIGFEDSCEAVVWQLATIQSEFGVPQMEIRSGQQAKFDWSARTDQDAKLAFKANLLPSALPTFFKRLSEFPEFVWRSHAGNGIVNGYTEADWPLDKAVEAFTALRETAVAAHGNLIITRCPPEWKQKLNIWGAPRGDLAVMHAVKRELDPQDLFNPGRFLVS